MNDQKQWKIGAKVPTELTSFSASETASSPKQWKVGEKVPADAVPQKAIPFKELATNEDYFTKAKDYMSATGEKPFDPTKESREDFINRFYSKRRSVEYNTVFGTAPELLALKNADEDRKRKIALGRQLYEQAAGATDKEGPGLARAVWDIGKSMVLDPSMYFGVGAGKAASSIAARTAAKKLSTDVVKRAAEKEAAVKLANKVGIGTSTATEAVTSGVADLLSQRAEQKTAEVLGQEVPEYSVERGAVSVLLPAIVSGGASALAARGTKIAEKGEAIQAELSRRKVTQLANSPQAQAPIAKALSKDFEEVHSEYVKKYGKDLLEQIDPAAAATDSKVQEAYSRSAVQMALNLMKDRPDEFGWNPAKEQISDAIYRTFSQIKTGDSIIAGEALESAINKAGLTPEKFAAMTKTTVSEAAKTLQAYSVASRAMNKLRQVNPDFDRKMKELYKVDNESVSAFSTISRVERESKAFATSGLDTLSRNIIGNNIGLTLKAGVDLMEGAIYSVGKTLKAAKGDRAATLKQTMGDAFKDSIGTFFYMKNADLAEDITEKLLQSNPTMLNQLTSVTSEADVGDVSVLARAAQTLNTSVDGLYRRATFAASVEKDLRRVGVDLYKDVLANNKEVPSSVLKKAINEALTDTMSYNPSKVAKSYSAFEEGAEHFGAAMVSLMEKPFASLAVPFPRFIANAFAFQYKYSPVGFIGARDFLSAAKRLEEAGDIQKAEMVRREGVKKSMQATVGIAALAAAYHYRKDNLDTPWNTVNGVDVRPLFPIAPYLAVGDWLARDVANGSGKAPTKEIIETVAGFKTPSGTTNTFLDTISGLFSSDESGQSVMETLGKLAGDFTGRFTQPFITKQVFDLFDTIRGDEAMLARDPNVLTSESDVGKAVEAGVNRVAAKLPVVKETLPPAVKRFQEQDTQTKDTEFFSRIVGMRKIPSPSEAEKEINRHGVELYKVYGRPSGDKDYDRLYISNINKRALDFVNTTINAPDYQNAISEEKKAMINNAIGKAAEVAREETNGFFNDNFPDKLMKIEYGKLSKDEKKIVNERYAADNNGRTMEEDKAYDQLKRYSNFDMLKRYSSGGVVDHQMKKLFS